MDDKKKDGPAPQAGYLLLAALGALVLVTAFNQYQITALNDIEMPSLAPAYQPAAGSGQASLAGAQGSAPVSLDGFDVIPTGVPEIYGDELGIRYDFVSADNPTLTDATIRTLAAYDQQITLEGDDLDRYIRIGLSISCEYCCGAESIIFPNGQAACGCAHSYAMRGLAKYLIQNHGDEYTDLEILEELGKWKVLFFPGIHEQKAAVLQQNGIELNYVNLASNAYRGIEQGASGGNMVGGC